MSSENTTSESPHTDTAKTPEEPESSGESGASGGGPSDMLDNSERRLFLKRAAVGGGGALLGGVGAYGAAMVSLDGRAAPDYPLTDETLFKPKDQRDVILNFVSARPSTRSTRSATNSTTACRTRSSTGSGALSTCTTSPGTTTGPVIRKRIEPCRKPAGNP